MRTILEMYTLKCILTVSNRYYVEKLLWNFHYYDKSSLSFVQAIFGTSEHS